ncbi:MAG: hypothetical protein R3C05_01490 [Pirellulaceae bacterium]
MIEENGGTLEDEDDIRQGLQNLFGINELIFLEPLTGSRPDMSICLRRSPHPTPSSSQSVIRRWMRKTRRS